ncbi:uncharacterized protein LOC106870616 [Octopus bimaculoides]|nr:uncharacterized protein LOC106870616 [Octopus bimaculoides]
MLFYLFIYFIFVRILINHRANVNCRTVYGDTPCHLAAYRGHREMVKLLVDCGNADLSVTNCKNRTSLDESICSSHDEISRYIHNAMRLKNYHPKRLAELRMTEIPLDLTAIPSSELNSFEHDERYPYSDDDNNDEEGNRFIVKANNGLAATTHYAVPFHCETPITNRLSSDMITPFPSAGPINNSNIYYSPNIYPYKIPNTSYSLQQRPVLQINQRDTDSISDSDMNSMVMNDLSSTNTAANHSQLSFLNICSRYISDNM